MTVKNSVILSQKSIAVFLVSAREFRQNMSHIERGRLVYTTEGQRSQHGYSFGMTIGLIKAQMCSYNTSIITPCNYKNKFRCSYIFKLIIGDVLTCLNHMFAGDCFAAIVWFNPSIWLKNGYHLSTTYTGS